MLKWIWQRLTGATIKPPDNQHLAQNQPARITARENEKSQSSTVKNFPKPEQSLIGQVPSRSSPSKVAPTRSQTESVASEPASGWISAGQSVTVAGDVISGGMVYVGKRLPTVRGTSGTDPCLINPQLKVDRAHPDDSGNGMGYWPSYSDISASCRAAYLTWLAHGRSQPDCYIGYVFLFFYGLERRVLVDLKVASLDRSRELELIIAEIERLLVTYGSNGSFNGYATRFLAVCRLFQAQEPLYKKSPPLERTDWEIPFEMRVALGQLVAQGQPIPADWALSWYIHSPQARLRTPATRCVKEFQQLFRSLYTQQYGEGMVLKPNKKKLKYSYHPASATFGGSIAVDIGNLSDVTALSAPLDRLQILVDDCTNALDPFSRWMGRNSDERKSYAAIALLPSELTESYQEDVKAFSQWLSESLCHDDQTLISLKHLVHYWQPEAEKLAKAEALLLSQFLKKQGYGIEPDTRFGGKVGALEGNVVLFKLPMTSLETLSSAYSAATLLLHIAVAIASTDASINATEQTFLESYLETASDLSESERLRLRAHLMWLLQKSLNLQGLKPRIEAIAPEQRAAIAEFAVNIAGADGPVNSKEISTLTKIYPLLGFGSQEVYSHIHQASMAHTPATEPVTVRPASSKQKGFVIPAPPEETENQAEKRVSEFRLDPSLLEAKKAESAAVAAILGDIFTEDELPATPLLEETSIPGLDRSHAEFVKKLATRSHWSRDELEQIVAELGLLLCGALDTINEAAFDCCEELLTDGDDPIEINSEVLEALLS